MTAQAVILAGGFGTRLGPLTQTQPKSMMQVGDKPFLEWLLKLLAGQGIKDFVFCVGYRAGQIQEYFQDGQKWNTRIEYSIENPPLGTGGALKKAAPLLQETFLVLNGDNYLELNYQDFIATFFKYPSAVGMLTCWRNDPPRFRSNVSLAKNGRTIISYDYQHPTDKDYVDCGIKIFSRQLLSFFDGRESFSLEIDTLPKMVEQEKLLAYIVAQPPLDIGTPDSLTQAQSILLKKGLLLGTPS